MTASMILPDAVIAAGPSTRRRPSGAALAAALFAAVLIGRSSNAAPNDVAALGPVIGHVDEHSARVWFRPAQADRHHRAWRCGAVASDGRAAAIGEATPDPDHDFTMVFDLDGLLPGTRYEVEVAGPAVESPHRAFFTTAPPVSVPSRVVLGFGSCAASKPEAIWDRILEEGCEGFVFLGDTPYIDTDRLVLARERHRAFLAPPEIARLLASMPTWWTWDDHDFGVNDGHGDFHGKHVARTAFTEYRANATFGQQLDGTPSTDRFGGGRGIHTSFRRGPIEVFLLDPRWFSRTEPSWADPDKPTCLGERQWAWLRRSLRESDAPFKVLATGMIWTDKGNAELDDWHTYAHERDAIFDFIAKERIPGVVLVGGDIHVSQAMRHRDRVGYDLWHFVTSPLHEKTIPSLDAPHPDKVFSAAEPNTFLKLTADSTGREPTLRAEWVALDGRRLFETRLSASDLGWPAASHEQAPDS